jgi:hypothetical protein
MLLRFLVLFAALLLCPVTLRGDPILNFNAVFQTPDTGPFSWQWSISIPAPIGPGAKLTTSNFLSQSTSQPGNNVVQVIISYENPPAFSVITNFSPGFTQASGIPLAGSGFAYPGPLTFPGTFVFRNVVGGYNQVATLTILDIPEPSARAIVLLALILIVYAAARAHTHAH